MSDTADIMIERVFPRHSLWPLVAPLARDLFCEAYLFKAPHLDLATLRDYADVQLSDAAFERQAQSDLRQTWLAHRNGEAIGYCAFEWDGEGGCYLERLYIRKTVQGFGLGKRLFEICRQEALARNLKKIWLTCWDQNEDAVQFYKKLGFVVTGTQPFEITRRDGTVYRDQDWVMELRLDSA